jgi:hypothetical protein
MRPGDEVECIKDMSRIWHLRNERFWHCATPVVGRRYIVRNVCPVSRDVPRILLAGLVNPVVKFYAHASGEASFPMKHFHKITTTTVETWLEKPTDADSEQWDNRREGQRVSTVSKFMSIGDDDDQYAMVGYTGFHKPMAPIAAVSDDFFLWLKSHAQPSACEWMIPGANHE